MTEEKLFGGAVILRPKDGAFDELLLMDGAECRVKMEMMRPNCMWIGIYPGGTRKAVAMWIEAKGGKLNVRVETE